VLALARRRGRRGVHSSDFDIAGATADGGKPIRRMAARVDELRNLGHVFEADRLPDRTVRYRLVRDADELAAALRSRSPAGATLVDGEDLGEQLPLELDDSPAPPLNAALADWEAA
jgi:hypothetical protein